MECPICDESFDTEESFSEHLESHKKLSFLSKTPEHVRVVEEKSIPHDVPIDVAYFFGRERFEESISQRLQSIENIEELVHRRNFAEQVKQIVSKHPFVYVPYFVDDLLNGVDSKKMLEKYHITNGISLQTIVKKRLKFDRNRYRKAQYDNAFEMNMKIPSWRDKYRVLRDNCEFFKNELLELTFVNILRSFVILTVIDHTDTGISRQDIVRKSRSLRDNYDIFKFVDEPLRGSFEGYFDSGLGGIVEAVLDEMYGARVLKKKSGKPDLFVLKLSIDNLKQSIVNELRYHDGSQSEYSIHSAMNNEYPSLRLIPGLGIAETALHELVGEKVVHLESRSNFRGSSLVFLNDDYERIQQQLQQFGNADFRFHGRQISPETFIHELRELEKGDLADHDDQVTRIAGLILAESVKLQAPHENIPEFDFTTDVTNYRFRKEQQEAMRELDFQINSNIFHCKVMLDKVLTLKRYEALKKSIPRGEQGIVITFKKIPEQVKQQLKHDRTVQVIDEHGLKIWVSITQKIPARKNSIAKLYHDPLSKLEKKIVKINHIDYEDGLASVSVFPEMKEITVLVRALEEIPLNETAPNEFDEFASNYKEFLSMLFQMSSIESMTAGLFDKKILSDSPKRSVATFDFEHGKASINWSKSEKQRALHCYCMQWADNNLYLCSHLVCCLDYAFRNYSMIHTTWNSPNNPLRKSCEALLKTNVTTILERLAEYEDGNMQVDDKLRNFVFGVLKIRQNHQY